MVSPKAMAALLVVHVTALLAAQTEAFIPRMQERERSRGQKKSLSMQQRSEEAGPQYPWELTEEEENGVIKLTAPVEIGMRLSARQLEKYQAVLDALLSGALLPTQPGPGRAGGWVSVAWAGLASPTLAFLFQRASEQADLFFRFALENSSVSLGRTPSPREMDSQRGWGCRAPYSSGAHSRHPVAEGQDKEQPAQPRCPTHSAYLASRGNFISAFSPPILQT
ncbi:promotilin [Heterocephalus glaber]|uniref:Promotilin n=1 Tax=Heterocephalus glaber TaxID=10181 RepID=A0AAX6PAK1_HETGA|nr:promotilin [Heterocephalus glaber]